MELSKEKKMAGYIGNMASGAGLGTAIAPGLGTAIGAGVGLISSLFGESDEDIRKRRQQELIKQNEMYRQRAIARANILKQQGIKDISKETATSVARAQADVGRRAAASGRVGDTEAMMLPVTSNISEAGGRTLEGAIKGYDTGISNIEDQYDTRAMNIQSDIAAAPIEPSFMDELMSLGGSAVDYLNQDKYLKAMEQINKQDTFNPSNMIMPKKPDYGYFNRPFSLGGR